MEKVNKGKKWAIAIIVIILLVEVFSTGYVYHNYISSGRADIASAKLFQGFVRFIIVGTILFFVYKGDRWAKWLSIVLLMLGGLISLSTLLIIFNIVLLAMGVIYLSVAIILISSASMNEFFRYQRGSIHINSSENMNDFHEDINL
ncbi:MAG TPA: hypothetical protein VN258_00275 [Mobilitalea sp.]|nr:hypothetical protein [Mobilitalea sp.]